MNNKAWLVALNILLVCAILWAAFFWHPEPEEVPLPVTAMQKPLSTTH